MNVIVSNKYQAMLSTLDIDVIKSINGEFTPGELANQFNNFFYNKMILDITAIKDYKQIAVIQELSVSFDMNKVIILLDDSEEANAPMYLSQLVSMGIYNFTRNLDAIKFLIDNPNTYKDVASYHNMEGVASQVPDMNGIGGVFGPMKTRVIGFKNVTSHAGSTTLVYMLKKHLEQFYKVVAVELDKNDFAFFSDESLKSISSLEFAAFVAMHQDLEAILVDLGDNGSETGCTDVVYLIEPGIIKLNRLIREDPKIFDKLKDKKIVLNRSILSNKDVSDFEYESNSKVFFNIPYIDDKKDHHKVMDEFGIALGFAKLKNPNGGKSGLFGLFK
ncbi:MAG: hypothetical protein IJO33_03385 [Bacilli bacterium]|nr:hypothetical protein [Bacilli bacterium]